jgi:hypothetical protein
MYTWEENACKSLTGRIEAIRPLDKHSDVWEATIKMYRIERVCEDKDWINLAQDGVLWRTVVKTVMNVRVR